MTCAAFLALGAVSFGSLASAQQKVDADMVQMRAETVLKAEDGAKEVNVRVEIDEDEMAKKRAINLSEFDINNDGILSRDEVGETMFRIFDRDGNMVIDNIEMKKVGFMTFTPMKKKTIETVDYFAADKEQKRTVTEEEFMETSRLIKFDKDKDGLTPLDFLGTTFYRVNVKKDGVIDLEEWKRAYAQSVRPLHEESFNYN
jgi:hypothetical protein